MKIALSGKNCPSTWYIFLYGPDRSYLFYSTLKFYILISLNLFARKILFFHIRESEHWSIFNFLKGIPAIFSKKCFWMFCFWKICWVYMSYFCVEMRIGKRYIFHKKHLQKLGYEFHIYQNAWNGNLVNPPDLSIFR